MLISRHLSFGFNRHKILKDLSLNLENRNQIIALLGPNGAGKTTLLNIWAGFYQKYKGQISKDSYRAFLLPDSPFIPKDMTIESCLKDFKSLYSHFNEKRARQMLKDFRLDPKKKVADYSKGMKEQLHLVFALAQDVDYYLLDEPLAGVDPLTREILIDLIKRYRRPNSVAIISTHLVQDMEELFDEVLMINDGKLILYENVRALQDDYRGLALDDIYKEVNRNVGTY